MQELDYKVQLENFYGPLDLLLHLVKENEVDISAISIVKIADQYINYIETMKNLDINLAGEFIALASQLLLIKSRALLLPIEPEEEEEDPSIELIRKLLEYKKFKDRARALEQLFLERSKRFTRPRMKLEGEEKEPLRNLELWDLVSLYAKVVKQISLDVPMTILYRDIPLEIFIKNIMDMLQNKKSAYFSELVGTKPEKESVVGTFLAMLELSKEQKVKTEQTDDKSDIRLELKD